LANKKKGTDKRKTLFKGVIIDKSFVIVECPACRQALEVNVEDKSNVDKTKVSPIELLKRERVANS
jgi:Fe-S oxidoreductase